MHFFAFSSSPCQCSILSKYIFFNWLVVHHLHGLKALIASTFFLLALLAARALSFYSRIFSYWSNVILLFFALLLPSRHTQNWIFNMILAVNLLLILYFFFATISTNSCMTPWSPSTLRFALLELFQFILLATTQIPICEENSGI